MIWYEIKNLMKKSCQGLKATDSYDIRRYLAIFFMAGGSMAMTLMLGYIITQLTPLSLFWVAMGCLLLIGLMQTGFVALIAKREVEITKDKVIVRDYAGKSSRYTDNEN